MNLIIFDVDGTLVHAAGKKDSKAFAQSYEETFGRPFPTIDWSQYDHVTDTVIFDSVIGQHFGRKPETQETLRFQNCYQDKLRRNRQDAPGHFSAVPGAREAIRRLEQQGWTVGVGTGGWKAPALIKLGHVEINIKDELFSGGDGKANREAILEEVISAAALANGSPPARVVYIGDALWDVATTRNMQIDFVGVRHRGDTQFLREAGAQAIIQDYTDFGLFLQAIEQARPPL